MIRQLFLLHRYLGIAVGALMVVWCLSGVVMMYVGYPQLEEGIRLEHLPAIDWAECSKVGDDSLGDTESVSDFRIEMLGGHPVLQLRAPGRRRLIDLDTGASITRISPQQAGSVAKAFTDGVNQTAPRLIGTVDYDQWTVSGEYGMDRPLYRFGLDDAAGTEIYISSTTGQAVQRTTRGERFWNWLGAVPHWLYFTKLRRNPSVWADIVIVSSLLGCFLVILGIFIGVLQLIRGPKGQLSPYGGLNLWHHMAGLAFGAVTLTWVSSGWLSMNPWGWLEGEGAQRERAALRGVTEFPGRQLKQSLAALARANSRGLVSVKSAPLHGQLYLIAETADGGRRRLDSGGASAPFSEADRVYIVDTLMGKAGDVGRAELLTQEDSYYFAHHREAAELPVYRIVLSDKSATRYYLDAISGELLVKADSSARWYRWLHEGAHRMDFTVWLRTRPAWDLTMLLLLFGVTTVCVSGTYLGLRRLLRWG
jgi:hypothetical protein